MISTDQYRAAIGLYSHGFPKRKGNIDTIVIGKTKVSLCIRILLFFLLSAFGAVEKHPGPTTRSEDIVNVLSDKVEKLEGVIDNLQAKMQKMNDRNVVLTNACLQLEERCERLESQGRRGNVVIHNLPEKPEGVESWEESEQKARQHFKNMGISDEIHIDRAHRLNPRKANSPVIVKLSFYKEREKIMEKARKIKREKRVNKQPLDGSETYVNEDFTSRVRRARALLRPGLMEAIQNNKKAFLSYDKLVIEGKNYWYDEVKKELSEHKPATMPCSELNDKLAELI